MAAKRREYQRNYENIRTGYTEGNTVRKLGDTWETRRERQPYESSPPARQEQKNPKTLQGITMASLLVLTMAITATVFICVQYLRMQESVLQVNNEIRTMEKTLTSMSSENTAAYDQINKTYDLGYVYRVAVKKLGMRYPNKNKVITYKKSNDDYVKQFGNIPQ
jgi:cell division protein FtsL